MRVTFDVVNSLDDIISELPPETGGILGSSDGDVITHFLYDKGVDASLRSCSYTPDVKVFNKCISDWSTQGINFAGIFHTHFAGVKTLSQADVVYIKNIMKAMPQGINQLYFPVYVLPDRIIISYKALKYENKITIQQDELVVV